MLAAPVLCVYRTVSISRRSARSTATGARTTVRAYSTMVPSVAVRYRMYTFISFLRYYRLTTRVIFYPLALHPGTTLRRCVAPAPSIHGTLPASTHAEREWAAVTGRRARRRQAAKQARVQTSARVWPAAGMGRAALT